MAGSLTAQESGHPSAVMERDMNGLHAVSRKVEDQMEWDPRCFSGYKSPLEGWTCTLDQSMTDCSRQIIVS